MGKRGPIQRSDAPRVPAPRRVRGGAAWPAAGCPDARPRVVTAGRGDPEVSLLTAQSRELLDPQFTVRQRWGKCNSAPPAPVCTRCSHGNFAESRMRPHCWTRTRAHTHAHARTHACTLTHTLMHAHSRMHTHARTCTRVRTHSLTRAQIHSHIHAGAHARTHTDTHSRMDACAHARRDAGGREAGGRGPGPSEQKGDQGHRLLSGSHRRRHGTALTAALRTRPAPLCGLSCRLMRGNPAPL